MKPRRGHAKASHHTRTGWLGYILHGGNELTEVFVLAEELAPTKKCISKQEPVLGAHRARRRGRGHKVAPGGCQAEGSRHPDGTACFPESGRDIPAPASLPWPADCPMLRLSRAQKHSWLWGSPCTWMWKCRRAMGPVIAVQMLGAGRCSQVWGSPPCVGIKYWDMSLTVNCPKWVSGA